MNTRTQLEAAAFRTLVKHLQWRTDVQNIDLMNLAGFCRNCLWKWLVAAAKEQGTELDPDTAAEWVYGMPKSEYKAKYQTPASDEAMHAFTTKTAGHAKHGSTK